MLEKEMWFTHFEECRWNTVCCFAGVLVVVLQDQLSIERERTSNEGEDMEQLSELRSFQDNERVVSLVWRLNFSDLTLKDQTANCSFDYVLTSSRKDRRKSEQKK